MEWLPYALTFIGGSGFGYVASLLVAPKSGRDKLRLEERRVSLEEQKPAREHRVARLEAAHTALTSAIAFSSASRPSGMSAEEHDSEAHEQLHTLTLAIVSVSTGGGLSDAQQTDLMRAVHCFVAWHLVEFHGADEHALSHHDLGLSDVRDNASALMQAMRVVVQLLDSVGGGASHGELRSRADRTLAKREARDRQVAIATERAKTRKGQRASDAVASQIAEAVNVVDDVGAWVFAKESNLRTNPDEWSRRELALLEALMVQTSRIVADYTGKPLARQLLLFNQAFALWGQAVSSRVVDSKDVADEELAALYDGVMAAYHQTGSSQMRV